MSEDDIAVLRAEVARLRDEVAQTRAMHEALIESLPFDFWARDRDGWCFSENSQTRRNWGSLIGTRPEDRDLPPEVIERWRDNNRRALSGEIVRGNVEYTVGGETKHIQNILAPIRKGDEIIGTLGVNLDFTELRRLERRLRETQRLETVGLLAGGVAHDINNIVMVILAITTMMRRQVAMGSQLAEDLSTIETASQRAAEICTQLLAYAGKRQLARELLDLNAVVADTAKLLRSTLPSGISLEVTSAAGIPIPVEIDPAQLRALVMNLILNASEAIGDDGRINVTVEAADPKRIGELANSHVGVVLDPARPYAILSVTDTGRGMPPETVERIFEPFFTTKARGRGLGLAAALGTVRAHEGAMHVESTVGRGSTFRVLLPYSSQALPRRDAQSDVTVAFRGSGVVLVVDDHEGVAIATARMMKELGFEAIVASSGAEALLRLAETAGVSLVMLDLMMPGLDGSATLERIRERHPKLPVILMSGFHDFAEPPTGTPLLRKPFGLDELTRAVRGVM